MPGAITAVEAADLASSVGYLDWDDERLFGILDLVYGAAPVGLCDEAYVRVEQRIEGCPWHGDTGTKGHMQWCRYSAGILLVSADEFSGGGFYFRDGMDRPIHHYCDLLVWSNVPGNDHMVTRNSGERIALLMFFGGSENNGSA